MLLRAYYALKPYLPVRLRYWLRRQRAKRLRIRHATTWPIDPSAAATPEGWPGWPDGKKFAFVLTHDVEGPEGYEKVRPLQEVEKELGFRSAFHFIPEGSYTVSAELRRRLVEQGWEVGVHDLHHDGSLFRCQRDFLRQSSSIRRYLRDWKAGGFRAGFMFHRLDWFHETGCQYDLSTFDTDPFEPQPDGVQTVFPFWVARGETCPIGINTRPPFAPRIASEGYLELPYTLPQDSTLFLILGETTPQIWLEKLDWVASHGGMALVNVHPDYLRFAGERESASTFSIDHYVALLTYVKKHYADQVWLARPRDIFDWYRKCAETGLERNRPTTA